MNFKFSKDSDDSEQEAPAEKKTQSTLLVLLLILVGGFAYLYFFTGLIKPQETQKTAEAPAPASDGVKMPLPPREGEAAAPGGKAPEKIEAPKTATTAPVAAVVPPAVPAKPKEEPKKVAVTKPLEKKPLPIPVADKEEKKAPVAKAEVKKPDAGATKPAVVDKKSTPAKESVQKAGSGAPAKPDTAGTAKKAPTGPWTLMVGNYTLEEALSADMGRVRKAGFKPVVKPSEHKKKSMNRLFVSDFNDRPSAQSTLDKLKRYTSDAFIIQQGGKFSVYAGSYLQSQSANAEKERLKGAGFSATVKHTTIAIPSQNLTVGPFDSKKAADAAVVKLKTAAIKATLVQK